MHSEWRRTQLVSGAFNGFTLPDPEFVRFHLRSFLDAASNITMDSVVELLDTDSGRRETFTLAYPEDENVRENLLSILYPVGTAILGFRIGDTISWPVPVGLRRMKVLTFHFNLKETND